MAHEGVIIRYTVGGQDFAGEIWRTTIDAYCGAINPSSPSPIELETLCDGIKALFKASLWDGTNGLASLNKAVLTLEYARAAVYHNGVGIGAFEKTGTVYNGTGPATTLPGSAALVVTKRTAVSTRAGRGRAYLPITAAVLEVASGQVADATVAQAATNYADFCHDINHSTVTLGGQVYAQTASVVAGWSVNPVTATPRDIISCSVDSRVDRQARRQTRAPSQFSSTAPVLA